MSTDNGNDAARTFTDLAEKALKDYYDFAPSSASYMGLHEYDGRVPDLSVEAITSWLRTLERHLDELDKLDTSNFDRDTRLDYDLLRQGLEAQRFRYGEQREHTYSPMPTLWLSDVTNYIKRDYAPIEERVRSMVEYERGIPKLLDQAIAAFEAPLSAPIAQIGVEMVSGQAAYMRKSLPEIVESQVDNDALLADFKKANAGAVDALEGFVGYLKEQQASAKEEFAIGKGMFERMLAVNELVDLPIERVLEVGRSDLEANKQAFVETARQIDPTKDVREVAEMVSLDHPTAKQLIPDTAAMLEEIRQFLIDRDLITVPSDVRCKVEETPEFMRWGFAFMDPPGPFEEKATEAYYYVTPVEEEWTEQQQEEWLRRFNYPTLRDVSVHEAYPGHYVHFLHASRVTSAVRKVFGSYSCVEGWAHYCEQMMVEQGYRGDNPQLHFAQLSEALLRNCRYVVSILIHTGEMTLDQATRFFMENGFMEELPARKEAVRGTFDPGYLNYTLGKLLILKLRDDVKAKEGASFNLKRFHDSMLALAYPPVPLVRQYILGRNGGSIL
jgi:uncharacterized protein (DUF885 family)